MTTHVSADGPSQADRVRGLRRLLALQELDVAVDRLLARHAALEGHSEITEARARAADTEARLGQLRLALDTVVREQRRLEGDLDLLQQKVDAERKRLFDGSVSNLKELQAIDAEVEGLKARMGRMEDNVLELMEQREGLEGQIGPLEAELVAAREELDEVERTSASELVEVETELDRRATQRAAMLPEFDPDLLGLYADLRRQKKGVGAAALEGGICMGCHQKLSPVYLSQLKRVEGPWRCEYCRRILIPR